ncbi:MAG: hypothetical protein IJR59_05935, partial [Firmicutes bacterium]|nr:hypothetical protein [Bacillota bacterium]
MKNRILSIILALVFIMLPAGQAVYADDANDAPSLDDFGYYCVYNADQLYWTVKHFSSDMKIRIMNDIVVNEGVMTKESTDARIWVPIGGYDYNFIGEIDGMGHTISGLYCPDGKYAAFVGINYGSIRDLGIINSYFCAIPESVQNVDYAYAGTFCAAMKQNAILENCYSLDNIIAGNCIAGGLAGIADSSSSIIRNIYSSSSVSSVQSSTNSSRRKWADPLVYTTTAQLINVFWDSSKITKNYNTSIKDYAFTPEQAATGEITYKLNENGIYDVWRQNLNIDGVDNDPYPLQSTAHYKVYCDDGIYTNHADDPDVYDPGSGEENLGDVEMNADGYYEIYNENHLYQFAQLVNENADKKNANAVLMRDIVLHTDKIVEMGFYNTWTPIGNINAP